MPTLLKGLREIHQELFTGTNGKPIIPFDRFCREHARNMKEHGVIFKLLLGSIGKGGPGRRKYFCGWDTEILNYFRVLAQKEEEERQKEKEKPQSE